MIIVSVLCLDELREHDILRQEEAQLMAELEQVRRELVELVRIKREMDQMVSARPRKIKNEMSGKESLTRCCDRMQRK